MKTTPLKLAKICGNCSRRNLLQKIGKVKNLDHCTGILIIDPNTTEVKCPRKKVS